MPEQAFIPRRCRALSESKRAAAPPSEINLEEVNLESLAELPAFVLLAEPGMGKSRAFQKLAETTGGTCISAADIRDLGVTDEQVLRPVYIDAVDEARAKGNSSILNDLRKIIHERKIQCFGIACRAADWLQSAQDDLQKVASKGECEAYQLLPFSHDDAMQFATPEGLRLTPALAQQAAQNGLSDMLGNPQSLQLLLEAAADQGGKLPDSRLAIYKIACQTLLREANQRHFEAQNTQQLWSDEDKLNAAGWLCALLLLSNTTAIADPKRMAVNGERELNLGDVLNAMPPSVKQAELVDAVLATRLFKKPAHYEPLHRTLAEFLAARFLQQQVQKHSLLHTRVSALMCTAEGYVLSNLRGLAGWLAALSSQQTPGLSQTLMQADPEAVLEYGDLTLLNTFQKQWLIASLYRRPRVVRWNHSQRGRNYAPLVCQDNQPYVALGFQHFNYTGPTSALNRTDVQLDTANVLLLAIQHSPPNPAWEPTLLECIRNDKLPSYLRKLAITALEVHANNAPQTQRQLLDALAAGELHDENYALMGCLLEALYPVHLGPAEIMRYADFSGSRITDAYELFWYYRLIEASLDEHLLLLMSAIEEALLDGKFHSSFAVPSCLGQLVVRAIEHYGESVPLECLEKWLSWCHGFTTQSVAAPLQVRDKTWTQRLLQWQLSHVEKLKEVIAWRIEFLSSHYGIASAICLSEVRPQLTGQFWLDLAARMLQKKYQEKAEYCIRQAYLYAQGNTETSGELVESIHVMAEAYPDWEESLFQEDLEKNWKRTNWLTEQAGRKREKAQETQNKKKLDFLLSNLEKIRLGSVLDYLNAAASAESHQYSHIVNTWREQHPELQTATQQGYTACLQMLTAEHAEASIRAHAEEKLLGMELPALLAAQHLYQQDSDAFFALGKDKLQALVTLHFLNQVRGADWFIPLAKKYPEWVEEVWWKACKRAMVSTPPIQIPWLHQLKAQDELKSLAQRLLPKVLQAWPAKFAEPSWRAFSEVLIACLQLSPQDEVVRIIQTRLRLKSIGVSQEAYLRMAGFWLAPQAFAVQLETYLDSPQGVREKMLGFVGQKLDQVQAMKQPKAWSPCHAALLVRLFGPLCSPLYPEGGSDPDSSDALGRGLLNTTISQLAHQLSDAAQEQLQHLCQDPRLQAWQEPLIRAAMEQKQRLSEYRFSQLSPADIAGSLNQKKPANPADLRAVALYALAQLQKKIANNPTNLINRFWTVDSNGRRPLPSHRPEPECRNVLADELEAMLKGIGITVLPESQHGAQNQCDIALHVAIDHGQEMLLPIEVKGDWNRDLWTAPEKQLAAKYASDLRCTSLGIYLVLWLGKNRGEAEKNFNRPNQKFETVEAFKKAMEKAMRDTPATEKLTLVVLDISIPER